MLDLRPTRGWKEGLEGWAGLVNAARGDGGLQMGGGAVTGCNEETRAGLSTRISYSSRDTSSPRSPRSEGQD